MQKNYPNVKLTSYNYSKYNGAFIIARPGGYDLTNLIPLNESITLSIQVYIGDDFNLDQNINISIDNVYFVISYVVFLPSPPGSVLVLGDDDKKGSVTEQPWIFLIIAIAAIAGGVFLGGYLIDYYLVLKYPKPVRKVRKFRRNLKKNVLPKVPILSRDVAFNEKYKEKILSIPSEMKTKRKRSVILKNKTINNRK